MKHPISIAVLYNKPAARFAKDASHIEAEDDTEHSAIEVCDALREKGARAELVPVTETDIDAVVDHIDADMAFNLIEWTGVDTPYAMTTFDRLNARNILYTGATKQNYLDSCDKTRIKAMVDAIGLPTAPWQAFVTGNEPVSATVVYPSIVKVSLEHSSVGIETDSIVRNPEELIRVVKKRIAEYKQPVFAEAFLTGREFQVTVLETNDGPTVLPPAEIVYAKGTDVPLLTYESRWDETDAEYNNSIVAVATLAPELETRLKTISLTAFQTLGFRDYARFDVRCDADEHPYFLELNSNPGLGDDEEYGMTLSYKAVGMTFADFIWEIVQSALRRNNAKLSLHDLSKKA